MIYLLVVAALLAADPQGVSTCASGANCSGNQSGGLSIGTQNNYYSTSPAPSVKKIAETTVTKNSDGSFSKSYVLDVADDIPPQSMIFEARGDTLLSIEVIPGGVGAAIAIPPGITSDGWRYYGYSLPTIGQFTIKLNFSDDRAPFEMRIKYNAEP